MGKFGWLIASGALIFLIALAFYSASTSSGPSLAGEPWSQETLKGDDEAPNKVTYYTDITCPHCAKFHLASVEGDAFDKEYIKTGKVQMEVRVTAMLQGKSVNSARAGESAYCAISQGKFYEYYDEIVAKLDEDYFSKDIGTSPMGPAIPQLDDEYYIAAADKAGLDKEGMKNCLDSNEMQGAIQESTQKAAQQLPYGAGVPYFIVNDFTTSGFGGGYDTVKQLMEAGGIKGD